MLYAEIESQIAEAEKSIARIDAILADLHPSQSHFRPELERCRNALVAVIRLMAEADDWPNVIW